MFKNLTLKNFKSFNNIKVDFIGINKLPKKTVFIYGENGSGKSNIISAFSFLKQTFDTLSVQGNLDNLLVNKSREKDIIELFKYKKSGISQLVEEVKLINSYENLELIFEFIIGVNSGIYKMIFNDNKIIEEELKYVLDKNITTLFKIDSEIYINPRIINDSKYTIELKNLTSKYFGNHTFMAIIFNELSRNSNKFMNDNINDKLNDVIEEFMSFRVSYNDNRGQESLSEVLLRNIETGTIDQNQISILKASEEALDGFFTTLYSDIKGVYYDIETKEKLLNYKLYFRKKICGDIRNIPYNLESTGTIKVLHIFSFLYEALKGRTVLIDEIDLGIHELLMDYIIKNVKNEIRGQLVVTTHNTKLLDNLSAEEVYVIKVDSNGNKEVLCINDINIKINDLRKYYLSGVLYGVPII